MLYSPLWGIYEPTLHDRKIDGLKLEESFEVKDQSAQFTNLLAKHSKFFCQKRKVSMFITHFLYGMMFQVTLKTNKSS